MRRTSPAEHYKGRPLFKTSTGVVAVPAVLMPLTFECIDVEGDRDVLGPILKFNLRVTLEGERPSSLIFFRIGKGRFHGRDDRTLGVLEEGERPGFPKVRMRLNGGEHSEFWVHARLSDESIEEMLQSIPDRIFLGELNVAFALATDVAAGQAVQFLRENVADLFNEQHFGVGGRVNGQMIANTFRPDLERWKLAIGRTRAGRIRIDVVTTFNLEREDVRALVSSIDKAEELRLSGKIPEAIGAIREITTWAGYKKQGEPDRYPKLAIYDLSESERDSLVKLLDYIWSWTSAGHHRVAGVDGKFTDEQAKMAIDAGSLGACSITHPSP